MHKHPIASKMVTDLMQFHSKFGLDAATTPSIREHSLMKFRLDFLKEELNEILEGYEEQDLEKVADGLVDLVYVAIGTAELMGLPWDQLWDEVQKANMAKERALKTTDSKRGSAFDVVKPEGWQPPNLQQHLTNYVHSRAFILHSRYQYHKLLSDLFRYF